MKSSQRCLRLMEKTSNVNRIMRLDPVSVLLGFLPQGVTFCSPFTPVYTAQESGDICTALAVLLPRAPTKDVCTGQVVYCGSSDRSSRVTPSPLGHKISCTPTGKVQGSSVSSSQSCRWPNTVFSAYAIWTARSFAFVTPFRVHT